MKQRTLETIYTPAKEPGFMGPDHTARALIQRPFSESDPFILLMDDVLDKKDQSPVGGPHPHAGFETVSLLLEGELGGDPHRMKAGDLQLMTAGSGIVHTETIDREARMRLLQLWLNLPAKHRWAAPRLQELLSEQVPHRTANGVDIRVYSGSLAGIHSAIQNYTPLLIADIRLDPFTTTELNIPADHNAFLVMLEGATEVGTEARVLTKDQVGWLDLPEDRSESVLTVGSAIEEARFILYAGQPQREPIVSHGPFIADTEAEIKDLYRQYRQGKMKHIATVINE